MKKFNKKSMLGFMTASAIVVTTVGSFAVWDTLTETSSGTLTVANPIVVTAADMGQMTETRTWEKVPEYEGSVTFEVAGLNDTTNTMLTLDPVLKNGEVAVDTNKYDITITQTEAENGLGGMIDSKVEQSNEYKVVVTPKAEAIDLAGKELTLEVTGTLAQTVE